MAQAHGQLDSPRLGRGEKWGSYSGGALYQGIPPHYLGQKGGFINSLNPRSQAELRHCYLVSPMKSFAVIVELTITPLQSKAVSEDTQSDIKFSIKIFKHYLTWVGFVQSVKGLNRTKTRTNLLLSKGEFYQQLHLNLICNSSLVSSMLTSLQIC